MNELDPEKTYYVSNEPAGTWEKSHPNYTPNEKKRRDQLPPKPGKEPTVTFSAKAVEAHNAKLVEQSRVLADRVKTAPVFFSQEGRGAKMLRRIAAKGERLRVA